MNEKKIVFYIGSLVRGGAERVITNLAEYFYEQGYRVWVVTKFRAREEYPLSDGIIRVLADLTAEEEKGRFLNFINRTRKLRRIIKRINPNIVVSFIGKSNLRAIAATMGTGIPVVVSVRSNPEREVGNGWKRLLTFALFQLAKGVVVQTTEARNFFPKSIQKKAIVLQNSLNPEFIRPVFRGEKRKEVVSVGRLDENKNQIMLMEAFEAIAQEFPDWKLVLYGDGEKREEWECAVNKWNLQKRIQFKGLQQEIAGKIEGASIFVLSSRQEGMPNALLEAMVLGLAVISTDCPCGGPRELIVSGKNGILIPVDDKEALINALRKLIQDNEARICYAANAMQLRERLLPEKINAEWKKYLEGIER